MNNEELKIKIAAILQSRAFDNGYRILEIGYITALDIADALIAAGIGDVKSLEISDASKEQSSINYYCEMREWKDKCREAEHRVERAERALKILIKNRYARCEVPTNLCDGIGCRSNECQKIILEYYLQQAEKELAEERK